MSIGDFQRSDSIEIHYQVDLKHKYSNLNDEIFTSIVY